MGHSLLLRGAEGLTWKTGRPRCPAPVCLGFKYEALLKPRQQLSLTSSKAEIGSLAVLSSTAPADHSIRNYWMFSRRKKGEGSTTERRQHSKYQPRSGSLFPAFKFPQESYRWTGIVHYLPNWRNILVKLISLLYLNLPWLWIIVGLSCKIILSN